MTENLGMIAGVLSLTMVVVSVLKRLVTKTPLLKLSIGWLPVMFYAVVVSMGLSVLAHVAGYLPGNTGQLMAQASLAALGSSGLYSVLRGSSAQSIKDAQMKPKSVGTPVDRKQVLHERAMGFVGKNIVPGFLILLACAGCSSDSLQRCYQAKEGYTVTLETVIKLRDQGIIPQSAVLNSKPYRVSARAALDAWELAAKSGQPTDSYENAFRAASWFVQSLLDAYSPKPTTRPNEGDGHGSRRRIGDNPAHSQPRGNRESGESGYYVRRVESRERQNCGC